ncbi:MAG TPA: hypothetical protein VL020_03230 [Pseudomonadales bacterium]|nr:hypothetical protein [Pseudomonadales bacterium]
MISQFKQDSANNRYEPKSDTTLVGGWVGQRKAWVLPGGRITLQVGTAKRALVTMARLRAVK